MVMVLRAGLVDTPSLYQLGDAYIGWFGADIEDDGQAGAADGIIRIISPFASRVKSLSVLHDSIMNADTDIRTQTVIGAVNQEHTQTILDTTDSEGTTFLYEPDYNLDALEMVEIQSDGAGTSGDEWWAYLLLARNGPTDIPTNVFIANGTIPDGTTTFTLNIPVPFDCEVIGLQYGVGETTTATTTLTAKKNGSTTIASVAVTANPAGTTAEVKPQDTVAASVSLCSTDDFIEIEAVGVASAAGKHPYNLILRRI